MRFFSASRLRCFQFRAVETPPARVIRGRFFARHTYRTRGSGSYRDLTGTVKVPVTLVGFTYCPSQFSSRPRVRTPFGARRTHLPFRHLPPRVSSSRSPPAKADQGLMAAAPGVWPRERTVPCDPPAPPWLLRTGPIKSTSRYCLGLPDPFSGFHRRPPVSTSGAFPPTGFSRDITTVLQRSRCYAARALRRHGGPTTSRSGGVSVRIGVPV